MVFQKKKFLFQSGNLLIFDVMAKINYFSHGDCGSFGVFHIDENFPIPNLYSDDFYCPTLSNDCYILGYFVGTSFRPISCHRYADDARFARKRDSDLFPGRSYRIIYVNVNITSYV